MAAVADYVEQRRIAFLRLRCGPGQHVTQCDLRECQVSTQEVLNAFADVLGDPETRARRIAFVTGSGLLRRQIRRMLKPKRARCFDGATDTLTWLRELQGARSA